MARVRWGWIALAGGALVIGLAVMASLSTYSCSSGGGESCGPIAVDYLGLAVVCAVTLGAVVYALVRAFRPRR